MARRSDVGRPVAVTVTVCALLVCGLTGPAAAGDAGLRQSPQSVAHQPALQQSQPDADNTVTRIEVYENGSARWTVRIRTRLDTDQRVDEYTAFQARFRNNTTRYLGPFRTRIRGVVADAADVTGRQMQATDFTASTSIQEVPRRWGVVTYRFTWTNFAATEGDRVVVGDVFEGGFFIARNDTLEILAPDGYGIARVEPAPDSRDNGTVSWTGREDFADGNPTVAFTPGAGRSDRGLVGSLGWPTVAGLVAVLLFGVAGAAVYVRRSRSPGDPDPAAASTDSDSPPHASGTPAQEPAAAGPSGAVLTDEERVLELLEANGGRMRQAAIADEFDWSASKTSRVIGGMAEDGTVEKLRMGRENLVALPEDTP